MRVTRHGPVRRLSLQESGKSVRNPARIRHPSFRWSRRRLQRDSAHEDWIADYVRLQKAALDSIPAAGVAGLVDTLRTALLGDRQVFIIGNGVGRQRVPFRDRPRQGRLRRPEAPVPLPFPNDNVAWMTAIGNDYSYEDVFVRQLENYGRSGTRSSR